ncbi:hypothetical protein GUJ93_ZPchr0009g371 [Zizania palustris]|uniref:KIB1-4 beta-propeller domain-containing protein n=1 Tax=Zizania palustris TaxID=103762 RepID=A0A8J5RH85_ZIZPA|nr:hypothetical protein GUJ93_ZPchr0009g371 [Zizania palustris]
MMKKKMVVAAAAQLSWKDLPVDLLHLVLMCLPSLADRLRLRAACRSWRVGGRRRGQPLPPPRPWFAFRDGSLVDHDGAAVGCATPILGRGVVSYLVVDNLAFLLHDDGGCSLLNPLSTSAATPLPMAVPADATGETTPESDSESESSPANRIEKAYAKLVLSSPLHSSEDPFVAVVTPKGFNVVVSSCKRRHGVASIISCPSRTKYPNENKDCISDIAFLQGKKLYALTKAEGLHLLDLDDNGLTNTTPDVPSGFQQCIADDDEQQEVRDQGDYHYPPVVVILRYLVESNGRLLMVRRWMSCPRISLLGDMDETYQFEVFEADLTGVHGRWTKVDSLDGQAIFLSSECSKSVTASQCAGGIQEDCIYFMHRIFDNPSREYFDTCSYPLADSGVYNLRDGRITPLLSEAAMQRLERKRQFLTWFFPADAIPLMAQRFLLEGLRNLGSF